MYFLQIADTHFHTDYLQIYDPFRFGLLQLSALEEKLSRLAKEITVPLDFIAHCGDVTHHGGITSYHQVHTALTRHFPGVPLLAVPGNHDHAHILPQVFPLTPPPGKGRAESLEGLQILSVDNSQQGLPNGIFSQELCLWILTHLASGADTLLLCHHHPIPDQSPMASAQLDPLFGRILEMPNLKAILCGHTHHRFAGAMGEIPCYTVGAMSFLAQEVEPGRLALTEAGEYYLFHYAPGKITLERAGDLGYHKNLGYAVLT